MVDGSRDRLPHIFVRDTSTTERYTRPPRGGDGNEIRLPDRDRQQHAEKLLGQLAEIQEKESNIVSRQKAIGLEVGHGIYISFESEPDFDLKFESLEFQSSGIELCAIKQFECKTVATVFVPEGKLDLFLNKIIKYKDEDTEKGEPSNKNLVESISEIKLAVLEALWTDDPTLFPKTDHKIWWEVWLRRSNKVNYYEDWLHRADQMDLTVGSESIHFLDRIILLVRATQKQIAESIYLLGAIAELRYAKDTADFFTSMDRTEQQEWIDDALRRLLPPPASAPGICILDTGVTEQHPLLQPAIDAKDTHTYEPAWGRMIDTDTEHKWPDWRLTVI